MLNKSKAFPNSAWKRALSCKTNKSYVLQDFWLMPLVKLNVEQLINLKTSFTTCFWGKEYSLFLAITFLHSRVGSLVARVVALR